MSLVATEAIGIIRGWIHRQQVVVIKVMLTKDQLQYKIREGQIFPQFVKPADSILMSVSDQLIKVFEASPNTQRASLLDTSKHIIDSTAGPVIVKRGLEKLLLDRTEFDTAPNEELIEFRQNLFTETSRLLSQDQFSDYKSYQQRVLQIVGDESQEEKEALGDRLYADLPNCQPVLSFKTLSAEHLLHRYNAAQVQGLLLHCNSLSLTLTDSMTAELRQLFKYLRFNQLLCTIRHVDKHKDQSLQGQEEKIGTDDCFQITVDGPLNLFYKTKRYGMNLANFFVAVLHQPRWEITAEIQFRNKSCSRLHLDESCGIKPISRQFLAYIPEDIQLFQEMLRNKTNDWQIHPGSHFLPLPGDFYCFPDYQLIHTSGIEVWIELFHPWHQGHLLARLNTLGGQENTLLILGVSKELQKQSIIAEALETSDYFSKYGFTFREVPTMGTLLPILNSLIKNDL